ncbi:hypothetical protein O1611_g1919 [Lasiodiplodia mahajangana]|uniref:Uncharacterized protein n=1 Tax=Lasiodiplodia mahajangana TaxID=1108764 RepID=A0ACC2JW19_9PEZI|nr:hypothetical protein O1611_g1919 [Lasiodiplodia mahajangana]
MLLRNPGCRVGVAAGPNTGKMGSTQFQHEREAYILPSTFSPWAGTEAATDSAGAHGRSITLAIPPGHRGESAISPVSAHSIAYSDSSSFYGERPASSDSSLSQPLGVAPLSLRREPEHATPQISMHSFRSIRPMYSLETIGSDRSSSTERWFSQHSTLGGSDSISPPEHTIPPASNVDSKSSAAIMSTHPDTQSIPMSAMDNPNHSPRSIVSEDENDANNVFPRCPEAHLGCNSRRDVYIKRWSWLYVTLIILSIYSTVLSGLWLVVAIFQPQYGRSISTGSGWQVTPSTATLLATLAARTIELTFVTVFVAVLGQVLTRRAISRFSQGVTLAEMTMRNWVIQPGSLFTHWEGLPSAATTLLGVLTLIATICSLFYTTASDAMVSPKLTHQDWVTRELQGSVHTSYANPTYVGQNCQNPLTNIDTIHSAESCMNVMFSGQSYHSLAAFLTDWDYIHMGMNSSKPNQRDRPIAKHNLFDNTTVASSWIETEDGDMQEKSATWNRVVNTVTLAMPHAGVYEAATDPINGILQPSELLGVGEYSVNASVVSPVVNVMCANMNAEELAPLVYTTWPYAATYTTKFGQRVGNDTWLDDVPVLTDGEWLNRTVVDDLFGWGEKYNREPPVFQLYPSDYNIVTNSSSLYVDSLYVLAKSPDIDDYTLCSMRSWVTTNCSTSFDLSGTSGGYMTARCSDAMDANAYKAVYPGPETQQPSWRLLGSLERANVGHGEGRGERS